MSQIPPKKGDIKPKEKFTQGLFMIKRFLILALAICPMMLSAAITRLSNSSFNLGEIGVYQVNFQVPVVEAGQLQLRLNGAPIESSTVGRATGNTQIVGFNLVETTSVNSVLELINPATNVAISIAQGSPESPLSAHLVVLRLR